MAGLTKKQMIQIINRGIGADQEYGNEIADIADSWRRACEVQLRKLKAVELKALIEKGLDGSYSHAAREMKEEMDGLNEDWGDEDGNTHSGI